MCRRIFLEGLCGYGEKCAYNHKKRSHAQSVDDDIINEEVHKLKTEVEILKSTIRSLAPDREENKMLENSIKDIKEDIKILEAANKKVIKIIKSIEDDLTDESDEESVSIESQQKSKDILKNEFTEAMSQEEGSFVK